MTSEPDSSTNDPRASLASPFSGAPHITEDDRLAVDAVLRSGWLGCGPEVAALEADLQRFCAGGEAVVVSSATAALSLTLAASGVGPGDEVVTSALTFAATANAIWSVGAQPVFVDTLADGSSLDPEQVLAAGSPKLRAVIPVAWRGEPTDTEALRAACLELASRHGRSVTVVEDGACSIGARHDDPLAVSPSAPMVVSFHPTKIVTAGLGGAVLGIDAASAERLRRARNQGLSAPAAARSRHDTYQVLDRGFALEMSDVHAALGRSQLRRVDAIIEARRRVFDRLRARLSDTGITCPASHRSRFGETNASLFALLVPDGVDRDTLRLALASRGIRIGLHYPLLADEPSFAGVRKVSDLAQSARLAATTLTLPTSPTQTDDDCDRLAGAVLDALAEVGAPARVAGR